MRNRLIRQAIVFRRLCLVCLGTVLLTLITTSLVAQTPEPFRWKFAQGDAFKVDLSQTSVVTSTVDQRSRKTTNTMQMFMNWNVTEVDNENGTATLAQSIDRITLNMVTPTKGGEKVTKLDTDDTDKNRGLADKLAKQIGPLVGTTISVVLSDRGDIQSVTVPDETMEVLRQAPASMQLRRVFTEQGMKQIIGQSAMTLPADTVDVGQQWGNTSRNREPARDV